MVSPLDGLKKLVAQSLKGQLRKGRLRRDNTGTTTNEFGDPVPGSPKFYTFEGIRENISIMSRAAAGIPDTDVTVLFILGLIKPETTPIKDDKVFIENLWYQCLEIVEVDPAGATMKWRCFVIPTPT